MLTTLDDDDTLPDIGEVRGGLDASRRDTDRDGCADVVEVADVDGNRSVNDSDRLAVARARSSASAPFTRRARQPRRCGLPTADYNGVVNDADTLVVSRIVLSDIRSIALDVQPNCTAARIGYDAN